MDLNIAQQLAPLVFSDTYSQARHKFRSAAPTTKAYKCTAAGPNGEAIFTDATYIGPLHGQNLLILVSGTHGVEGYCGSAAQLAFFEAKFHERLPPSTAVLLIHALNCYGYAWDRRVTAEGCDLNRNFIDFSKPLPVNPGYEELAPYFLPTDNTPEAITRAEAAIEAYRELHGPRGLREARTSGQFTHPSGVFYGGSAPTEARRTLEAIVADFDVASRENVLIVDYHTGLGPYGYGEIQCEQASGQRGYERAVRMFGPSVTSPDIGTSSAVALQGTQDDYWERILGNRHTYVCLEFGTYDTERGRKLLRDDHWLFAYKRDEIGSDVGRRIRQATKHHFFPQNIDWKEMVVWRSHQVHRQAIEAFDTWNP